MTNLRQNHWKRAYRTKAADTISWFQQVLSPSLNERPMFVIKRRKADSPFSAMMGSGDPTSAVR